jgi:hypothetical protein
MVICEPTVLHSAWNSVLTWHVVAGWNVNRATRAVCYPGPPPTIQFRNPGTPPGPAPVKPPGAFRKWLSGAWRGSKCMGRQFLALHGSLWYVVLRHVSLHTCPSQPSSNNHFVSKQHWFLLSTTVQKTLSLSVNWFHLRSFLINSAFYFEKENQLKIDGFQLQSFLTNRRSWGLKGKSIESRCKWVESKLISIELLSYWEMFLRFKRRISWK